MPRYENMRGSLGTKAVIVIFLLSLFTLFIAQNTAVVDIQFLLWKVSLSRVILLLGALFIGILIGLVIGWEACNRKREIKH
jgi:uncharacterized integral membrane protein